MTSRKFQKFIWNWSKQNTRHFPWRRTRDPYKILVSEIMLQQTQTSRVREKYPIFIKTFPHFKTLAASPVRKLLKTWMGMGYNRRALYLKEIAKITLRDHRGILPRDPKLLRAFPGIGHYTAHAVACFSYDNCNPFLDTNIRRVIIRLFFPRKRLVHDNEVLTVLTRIEPKKRKREWYLALMDYGAMAIPKSDKNPNRRSRHWTKQSRFEGSTRQVRSLLVKDLLKNNSQTTRSLKRSLRKKGINSKLLEARYFIQILKSLQRDGLIVYKKGLWQMR